MDRYDVLITWVCAVVVIALLVILDEPPRFRHAREVIEAFKRLRKGDYSDDEINKHT